MNSVKFRLRMVAMPVFLLFLCVFPRGAGAATVEVMIENFAFVPPTVTINAGDSVTWRQLDSIGHTSTSGNSPVPNGIWDSPLLSAGQTFTRTFSSAGSFPFFCRPHPFMQGTIVVKAAPVEPPVVAITSPANDTMLAMPGSVTITATATVNGSTITGVEFFDGSTSLGTDNSSPFSVTVDLAAGAHSLTARATAANGQTATSSAIMVSVGSGAMPIDDPFPPIAKSDLTIELETVAEGLAAPLGLAAPVDGSGRLFIYEQNGRVHVWANGAMQSEPLLDLGSRLVSLNANYDERGLLGLALHPNFNENGLLYTYSSEPNGAAADFPNADGANDHQSVIAEWKIDAGNSNRVDLSTRREILRIDEPQSNHNGGQMHFGPDGFLYIALGDGGAADDQGNGHSAQGNGQDLEKILGKILRIDVNTRTSANGQYGLPSDNPFVGAAGLDEIYAYGFRNPYRWSFDRWTGEMYVGDVGQNEIEEVDRVFKGGNYGWRIKEGSFYFQPNGDGNGFISTQPAVEVPANLVDPIAEYDHSEGTAIIGGFVYRGKALPGLLGKYVTGDFGTFSAPAGRLFYLDRNEVREMRIGGDNRALGLWLKGLGEDSQGELYVMGSTSLGPTGTGGKVLKMVPRTNDLSFIAFRREGGNATVTLNGGIGPFVLQGAQFVVDPVCGTVAASDQRTITAPAGGRLGFFRAADLAGNPAVAFTVRMSGAAERPNPVTTDGTGTGILTLEASTLHFEISYAGLSGTATAAHIHGPASAAEAAGVVINLQPYNGGSFGSSGRLSGAIVLTPEQKALILSGRSYVNIHTDANKSGEIRGQIAPVVFKASLSGGAERPNPVPTNGKGTATLLLAGDQLTFEISYGGLTGPAMAAHIHGPATSEMSTNVMINLAPFNGGAFGVSGSMGGTVTLTPDQLAALVDGLTYINIHTPQNGGGEIRGQIVPVSTAAPLSALLSGAGERPDPVQTSASGAGTFALEGSTLLFNIRYGGLPSSAIAAHIHGPATAATAASVIIDLSPYNGGAFGTNGTLAGRVKLTDEQRAWVLQGRAYVNVHTTEHKSGEIRGQIAPAVNHAELLGASERANAVQTAATGYGTFLLVGDQLKVAVSYSGLSGPATAAHIHGAAGPEAAASVLIDMAPLNGGAFGAAGSFAGTVTLTPENLASLIDGLTYFNIHTSANKSGEIRGQIVR